MTHRIAAHSQSVSTVAITDRIDPYQKRFHELVIIDSTVEDYQYLIQGIKPGIDWAILNSEQDGIEQITRIIANSPDIEILHLVSHGAPGCLFLGNTQLSLDTLEQYRSQLQTWVSSSSNLPMTSSLLIYGCQVAVGDAGEEFITKLHNFTQANIAASYTLTGNAALGGNWKLDLIIGQIKPKLAFQSATTAAYVGVLAEQP